MQILLLDNGLIRRFGKRILDVDSSVGITLINKNLAIENKKQVKNPMVDKMIKEAPIDKGIGKKEEEYNKEEIFPDLIVIK